MNPSSSSLATTAVSVFSVAVVVLLLASGSPIVGAYTAQSLYDALRDDIELLNATSYNEVIFNSERATFVECYAHWCGACQKYAKHWKEFAKETKPWHAKVVRVAAINCGDSFNDKTCREHGVHYYPTLKLYPPHASYAAPNHDEVVVKNDGPEVLVERVIQFLEQIHNKPASWPDLEPYTSKRLDPLFAFHQQMSYGILIFEKDDSFVGRKLILDFSAYTDRLVIRRVTESSNPSLFAKFEINSNRLPALFVVNNLKPVKTHEALTVDRLRKLAEEAKHAANNDFDDDEANEEEEEDKIDHQEGTGRQHVNVRQLFAKMIRLFIKYKRLASTTELSVLENEAKAGQVHKEQIKKDETGAHLQNMDNRVYMQDLESSLNVMLRSEIGHHDTIEGESLDALKEWLRILNKYFPGRRQVRNYLRNIYDQISSPDVKQLSGEQWKKLVDSDKPQSNLPNVVEWRHCQGSEAKYRGYPCSLWTLFHVLTVAQIEYEKAQPRPFEVNFNINEVIESIISFVKHFFSCRECSENFMKETKDYQRHLKNPYDAIQYLWKVHNKVNDRLAKDQITDQDPKHAKIQFPSVQQCPKCYLETAKDKVLAEHESPWSTNDILLFLSSFYSKYQIDGVEELENKLAKKPPLPPPPSPVDVKIPPVVRKEEPLVVDRRRDGHNLEADEKVLDKLENDWLQVSAQKTSDLKLGFVMVLFVLASFGFLFIYFGFFRRKQKLKKHII